MSAKPERAAAMPSKPSHFYVYYRIAEDTAAARERVRALMAEVEASTGVSGALLARSDDASTWMEVYSPVAQATAFRRILATLADKHEAAALTKDGRRHVEHFSALKQPARRRKA